MRTYIWLAALLAIGSWSFALNNQAVAHGGIDLAGFDCEDEDSGDDSRAVLDCHDDDSEETEDSSRVVLDCGDEHEEEGRTLDCHEEETEDSGRIVFDCGEEHEDEE